MITVKCLIACLIAALLSTTYALPTRTHGLQHRIMTPWTRPHGLKHDLVNLRALRGGQNMSLSNSSLQHDEVNLNNTTCNASLGEVEEIVYRELKPFMTLAKKYRWVPTAHSDFHDKCNLVALPILGGAALYGLIYSDQRVHRVLTYIGFIYILLDTVWLWVYPLIVKSPGIVMRHHLATLLVLLDPLLRPSHSLYTSACMLVELNTLLLLLRRHLNYSLIIEVPFLVSWIALRVLWYPFLMYYFILCGIPELRAYYPKALWDARDRLEGDNPKRMYFVSLIAWIGVTFFQLMWTKMVFLSHPWFQHLFMSKEQYRKYLSEKEARRAKEASQPGTAKAKGFL